METDKKQWRTLAPDTYRQLLELTERPLLETGSIKFAGAVIRAVWKLAKVQLVIVADGGSQWLVKVPVGHLIDVYNAAEGATGWMRIVGDDLQRLENWSKLAYEACLALE